MSVHSGPDVEVGSMIAYLDLFNNYCFRGEPTTNLVRIQSDYTGTAYGPDNEWAGSVLDKTYNPDIKTPIGSGATLIMESGGTGWHVLSRFGGGGSGNYSISAYILPVSNDIETVDIGLLSDGTNKIIFNLNSREITYNHPTAPRVAFIEDVREYPGWLRIGANIFGRFGGWVGSIGYNTSSQYTGSPSAKKMYITGIQSELKYAPTRYSEPQQVRGETPGTGGGLIDISGSGNNVNFTTGFNIVEYNQKYMHFDGSSYASIPTTLNAISILAFIRISSGSNGIIYGPYANGHDNWLSITNSRLRFYASEATDLNNFILDGNTVLSTGVWYQVGCTIDGDTAKIYVDGNEDGSVTKAFTIAPWNSQATLGRRGAIAQSYFNGDISNLQVYNKVLNDSEIKRNFNAFRGRYLK